MSALHSKQRLALEVVGFGQVDTAPFRSAVAGLKASMHGSVPLRMVVVDDYLNDQLAAFNRTAIDQNFAWLLVKPSGALSWIGPVFEPGGPCWHCLSDRLLLNGYSCALSGDECANQSPHSAIPAKLTHDIVAAISVREVIEHLKTEKRAELRYRLITFDAARLHAQYHPVLKLPNCAACGSVPVPPMRIALKSCPKAGGASGYRTCSAEDTWQRLTKQVSSLTGLISSLSATSTQGQSAAVPMHAYVCQFRGHPWQKEEPRAARLELAFGKGMSDVQAKVSCLAEAIERYCGAYDRSDARVVNRCADLPGAIHPHDLLMFSETQYEKREVLNRPDDLFNWVPHRFDSEVPIEWTAAWSLRDNAVRYLPSAFCYYYYPDKDNRRFCIANSNGCASGNTVEEATLQALFELIERDCIGIWWYNKLRLPAVDLESFDEPYFSQIIAYLRAHRRCLQVIDLTSDLLIPAFVAVSWREDGRSLLFGTGAHVDAKLAITRAITELNQRLPFALRIDQGLPVSAGPAEVRIGKWLREEHISDHNYLEPDNCPAKTKNDYVMLPTSDLLLDITHVIEKFRLLGLDTIMLNMSKPEIELATVRVTVPGLRHSWARFAPGRLYEVPVKSGWLTAETAEKDLNALAYFV